MTSNSETSCVSPRAGITGMRHQAYPKLLFIVKNRIFNSFLHWKYCLPGKTLSNNLLFFFQKGVCVFNSLVYVGNKLNSSRFSREFLMFKE